MYTHELLFTELAKLCAFNLTLLTFAHLVNLQQRIYIKNTFNNLDIEVYISTSWQHRNCLQSEFGNIIM